MKTKLLLSALLTFSFLLSPCTAQVPQGFNYQAIARDGSGNPITGATIKVKLSVLSDTTGFYASGSGAYIWEEEHLNVKTNSFGLFTVVFGDLSASKIQGNVSSFSAISWSQSPLFIGTKIANPTTYKNLGSAKLWSVPYSMITAIADSTKGLLTGSKLSVVSSNDLGTDALFEVKRKDGQTVFAVYPDAVNVYLPTTGKGATKGGFAIGSFGSSKAPSQNYLLVKPDTVRIFIDDTPGKASKGGFAIGGFGTSKTPSQHLLEVTPDSIRAYIDTNTKGIKGGFAIGGFGADKAPGEQYLRVTRDSTRVYVNESGKGVKGGFAIGSISGGKGNANPINFLDLTPNNYFIGQESGKNNTTGMYNSFIGYQSDTSNTSGSNNVFLGYQSGLSNNTGGSNLFLGYQSGYYNLNGSGNLFNGYMSGYSNTAGNYNSFLGYRSGFSNTVGTANTFLGSYAGSMNTTGSHNTFIGFNSGTSNNFGNANIFIGDSTGFTNLVGSNNIFIGPKSGFSNIGNYNIFQGYQSGYNNQTGSNNTFIGYQAGLNNTTGVRNLFIGHQAGISNNVGIDNLYIGLWAGQQHQSGSTNVFLGESAGSNGTTGSGNVCLGYSAGPNINSNGNIVIGSSSCPTLNSGHSNIIIGAGADLNDGTGSNNVVIGPNAKATFTGSNKLFIWNTNVGGPLIGGDFSNKLVGINCMPTTRTLEVNGDALVTGSLYISGGGYSSIYDYFNYPFVQQGWASGWGNYTALYQGWNWTANIGSIITCEGYPLLVMKGSSGSPNQTTLLTVDISGNLNVPGNVYLPSVYSHTTGSTYHVLYIDNSGNIGGIASSARYKKNISDMENSDWLYDLRPVNFNYKSDSLNIKQYGLIAEEVERVNPLFVIYGKEGKPESVNYDMLITPLIKVVQEQQKIIDSQKARLSGQESELNSLRTRVDQIETLLAKAAVK